MLDDEVRFNAALGDRIASRRRMLGKSQGALAEVVGVPRTSLILIERGRQKVPAFTLVRLAQALDIDVHSLLGLGNDAASLTELPIDAPAAVRDFVSNVRRAARTGRRTTS